MKTNDKNSYRTAEKIKNAIEEHIIVTERQIERLQKVFKLLGDSDREIKCSAIESLIEENNRILEETQPRAIRDAAIISS